MDAAKEVCDAAANSRVHKNQLGITRTHLQQTAQEVYGRKAKAMLSRIRHDLDNVYGSGELSVELNEMKELR